MSCGDTVMSVISAKSRGCAGVLRTKGEFPCDGGLGRGVCGAGDEAELFGGFEARAGGEEVEVVRGRGEGKPAV